MPAPIRRSAISRSIIFYSPEGARPLLNQTGVRLQSLWDITRIKLRESFQPLHNIIIHGQVASYLCSFAENSLLPFHPILSHKLQNGQQIMAQNLHCRLSLHHVLRVYKLNVIVIICKGCKPDRSDHKLVFFNLTWVKVVLVAAHGTIRSLIMSSMGCDSFIAKKRTC